MKTTSLEVSKELYELSGWDDTQNSWKRLMTYNTLQWKDWFAADYNNKAWHDVGEETLPAYDLGYLLRKLPQGMSVGGRWTGLRFMRRQTEPGTYAEYVFRYGKRFEVEDDSPEDAAARLAIELFKSGVLTK